MSGVAARASLPRRRVFQRQVGEHNPLRLFLPASGRPMILRVFQPLTGSMSEDRHAMASEFVRRVRVTTAFPFVGRVPTSTERQCISCRDGGSVVNLSVSTPLSSQ